MSWNNITDKTVPMWLDFAGEFWPVKIVNENNFDLSGYGFKKNAVTNKYVLDANLICVQYYDAEKCLSVVEKSYLSPIVWTNDAQNEARCNVSRDIRNAFINARKDAVENGKIPMNSNTMNPNTNNNNNNVRQIRDLSAADARRLVAIVEKLDPERAAQIYEHYNKDPVRRDRSDGSSDYLSTPPKRPGQNNNNNNQQQHVRAVPPPPPPRQPEQHQLQNQPQPQQHQQHIRPVNVAAPLPPPPPPPPPPARPAAAAEAAVAAALAAAQQRRDQWAAPQPQMTEAERREMVAKEEKRLKKLAKQHEEAMLKKRIEEAESQRFKAHFERIEKEKREQEGNNNSQNNNNNNNMMMMMAPPSRNNTKRDESSVPRDAFAAAVRPRIAAADDSSSQEQNQSQPTKTPMDKSRRDKLRKVDLRRRRRAKRCYRGEITTWQAEDAAAILQHKLSDILGAVNYEGVEVVGAFTFENCISTIKDGKVTLNLSQGVSQKLFSARTGGNATNNNTRLLLLPVSSPSGTNGDDNDNNNNNNNRRNNNVDAAAQIRNNNNNEEFRCPYGWMEKINLGSTTRPKRDTEFKVAVLSSNNGSGEILSAPNNWKIPTTKREDLEPARVPIPLDITESVVKYYTNNNNNNNSSTKINLSLFIDGLPGVPSRKNDIDHHHKNANEEQDDEDLDSVDSQDSGLGDHFEIPWHAVIVAVLCQKERSTNEIIDILQRKNASEIHNNALRMAKNNHGNHQNNKNTNPMMMMMTTTKPSSTSPKRNGQPNTNDDDDDDDDSLAEMCSKVTVQAKCPSSFVRISVPVRSYCCRNSHVQCVDAATVIQAARQSRLWRCPSCLKGAPFDTWGTDMEFQAALRQHPNCETFEAVGPDRVTGRYEYTARYGANGNVNNNNNNTNSNLLSAGVARQNTVVKPAIPQQQQQQVPLPQLQQQRHFSPPPPPKNNITTTVTNANVKNDVIMLEDD